MENKKLLVSLVAILAVVLTIASVSADNFAGNFVVKVNGVVASGGSVNVAAVAGQTLPVEVQYTATSNASDVRLKVWLSGAQGYSVSSNRFDVIAGSTYDQLVAVQVPYNIDPSENLQLEVSLESQDSGVTNLPEISLAGQRESYLLEILDVNVASQITAGDNVPVDVVLRNRGSHLAEDTFVQVSIPELGVSQKAYFADMSAVDQPVDTATNTLLDQTDSAERGMLLSIPASAKPGVYTVQIEAYNGDSSTVTTKKVAIVGAASNSVVAADTQSRTFAVGDEGTYTMTLVNSGDKIVVYNLVAENSNDALSVNVDQPVVAIPAGSSKNVKVSAVASKAGSYAFSVDVQSGGNLVSRQNFMANVSGSSASSLSGNTAVVLTVILAIIFVVLLVVLIVLLTRKPEKAQEFGESYY